MRPKDKENRPSLSLSRKKPQDMSVTSSKHTRLSVKQASGTDVALNTRFNFDTAGSYKDMLVNIVPQNTF